ncbi:hypothetical protein H1C71_018651, partial [Ictidomys tridecemlineatus]
GAPRRAALRSCHGQRARGPARETCKLTWLQKEPKRDVAVRASAPVQCPARKEGSAQSGPVPFPARPPLVLDTAPSRWRPVPSVIFWVCLCDTFMFFSFS